MGAGVGITPLRALAEGLDYAPGDATVLHRHRATPLFADEFDALVRERGLVVHDLPGPRRSPGSWLPVHVPGATDVATLQLLVPDVAERDVYLCGPAAWADSVRRTALVAGVPADRIHQEVFAW